MMPVQDLRGPCADEACHILSKAVGLTFEQAQHMGDVYEADSNSDYNRYCNEVWDALERTERLLPLGWFEALFAETEWVDRTKAIHAIADAVVATLVRNEISKEAFNCLTLPFLVGRGRVPGALTKVDLLTNRWENAHIVSV
jgi:hypothetical protein